ncbi:hypothetical protein DH2020_046229 [Rehmannia glutinosa]|uniref:Uncharacterized protein n=1 Tax=Rehmannia glutinosa TaxID=99300 RepID=A0ABR0UBV9_REHGL
MLSAAGLSGGVSETKNSKTLALAPPPIGATKIRSPLPPAPNAAAAARLTTAGHGSALNRSKETSSRPSDFISDLSQLKAVSLFTLSSILCSVKYAFLRSLRSECRFP